jgi:adenosylhomocysteine nucleosidase
MIKHPIIVLISANSEWRAVKSILSPKDIHSTPMGETFVHQGNIFFHGGWGKVSAAATAQYVIDTYQPDLLVNLGTCGGFDGRIQCGTVILVTKTIIYDIIEQMSDQEEAIEHYTTNLDLSWLHDPLPYPVQPGLLVSADRDILAKDIPDLIQKYGAVAADWESGAIAWVAKQNGVRCLILRGVTDLVSPTGGEAYGNIALFHTRTLDTMKNLLGQLPDWLASAAYHRMAEIVPRV